MRFTSIILAAGVAYLANAQSESSTTTAPAMSSTDPNSAAASSAAAEMVRCIDACDDGDVNCKAACVAVPSPNDDQANATNKCVSECPQGNGTEAEIISYTKCVNDCIATNYYTSVGGTPKPTGSAGGNGGNNGGNGNGNGNSGSDNNSDNGNANPTGTSGGDQTGTGTGPAPTQSTGAATVMGASGAVVGVVGFLAALMAL